MESLNEIDDEDLEVFLVESDEILAQFEQDVLSLQHNSPNPERINQLYRALHTIKGNCGFIPFPKLEAIAHTGETLLDQIRTAQRSISPAIVAVLLQLTDAMRQMLRTIEATKTEGHQDYFGLMAALTDLGTANGAISGAINGAIESPNGVRKLEAGKLEVGKLEALDAVSVISHDSADSALTDSTIRVQIDLLDQVMNLVGELVLARNRVLQLTKKSRDPALVSTCQQIDLITNELQDRVMRTRMQPINTLWRNLPRLARDLAIGCGKEVTLTLEGGDTELDRNLVAAVKDPLTHLIRNCIDHGIESAEVRSAAGKPMQGRLTLKALQEGDKVILEVSDDGAGIDPVQIKARSQQIGLISAAQAKVMRDRDVLELIFLPGFSTATAVTRLSGRGVGMDVVRRNLESVNGSVEVESQLGQGTTFRLKIPLTLAIMPTLLVESGGERFAIPQAAVQELFSIEGEEAIDRSIETLLDTSVYRLRGQILPLVNLAAVLQLVPAQTDLLSCVVIAIDGYRFGLIVDRIDDTQDIVVKPLSKQLKTLDMFAGATVLGDGNAALILNPPGLARLAGIQKQAHQTEQIAATEQQDSQLILIVLGPQNARMGIVLNQATRLETVPSSVIQQVGEQYLMPYRDRVVTLIDLQAVFTGKGRSLDQFAEVVSIVVITLSADRTVGLIVNQILDIVEESLTVTGAAMRAGARCYATVQGQITEILDLEAIVDLANPYRENLRGMPATQASVTGIRG